MIKIKWFDEELQNDYVGIKNNDKNYSPKIESIIPIIEADLIDEIKNNNFPYDIADLFKENGVVSTEKIQAFLKLDFSQVEKEPVLQNYIARRSLSVRILKGIRKEDYKEWSKNKSNKKIKYYLNEKFSEYKDTYGDYPAYPNAASFNIWVPYFKKELVKTVLSEPYEKVFNYDKLKDKTRHTLMDSLNIPVCPFCNRQYITSWDDVKKNETKTTADLDHFYPKSEYPLFALSLFNFVPSCQVCNSRMKLDDFLNDDGNRPVYPYTESFGDSVVFRASASAPTNSAKELLEVWLGENTDNLKIQLDYGRKDDDSKLTLYQKRVKRSIELYHLEEVYQAHKSYVSELMLKKRIYDDGEYLKGLKNIFKGFDYNKLCQDNDDMIYIINSELSITHKQLEAFLYGYNWENGQDVTRPLSKLSFDILKR